MTTPIEDTTIDDKFAFSKVAIMQAVLTMPGIFATGIITDDKAGIYSIAEPVNPTTTIAIIACKDDAIAIKFVIKFNRIISTEAFDIVTALNILPVHKTVSIGMATGNSLLHGLKSGSSELEEAGSLLQCSSFIGATLSSLDSDSLIKGVSAVVLEEGDVKHSDPLPPSWDAEGDAASTAVAIEDNICNAGIAGLVVTVVDLKPDPSGHFTAILASKFSDEGVDDKFTVMTATVTRSGILRNIVAKHGLDLTALFKLPEFEFVSLGVKMVYSVMLTGSVPEALYE